MEGMVGSALAEEGVSGVSSYISGKLEEKASREHTVARLEMALSQLEFALERAGKLPITYVSLLRRMKMLKRAYLQGTNLLNKAQAQAQAGSSRTRPRRVRGTPTKTALPRRHLISLGRGAPRQRRRTLFDLLRRPDLRVVRRVRRQARRRRRRGGVPAPARRLPRLPAPQDLLEGKTLRYETTSSSNSKRGGGRRQEHRHHSTLCVIWPVRLEERGVEARLLYQHLDRERPERRFRVRLMLRLSEDTDIVGVAVKCVRSLAAQFKLAAAASSAAAGELALLPQRLQDDDDTAHSYGEPGSRLRRRRGERRRVDFLVAAMDRLPSRPSGRRGGPGGRRGVNESA